MTNSIQLFTFNQKEVRTITKPNSSVWFVASDIATQLDYAEAKDLTRMLDNDETDKHIVPTSSLNGTKQNREVSIINESGLYHAIFKSRKTEAKTFRKWVTSEVLPSIRKTGSYDTKQLQTLENNIKTLEHNNKSLCEVISRYESGLTHDRVCNYLNNMCNSVASWR
jgi:prophage antirepressor-like protein